MKFEVEFDCPLAEPINTDSWGFISANVTEGEWTNHKKYWFNSKVEMIFYFCLAPEDYVSAEVGTADDRAWFRKTMTELLVPILEASHSKSQEPSNAIQIINNKSQCSTRIIWCGKYQGLLTGREPFELRLRDQYFKDRQLIQVPYDIRAQEIGHFSEWLLEFGEFT